MATKGEIASISEDDDSTASHLGRSDAPSGVDVSDRRAAFLWAVLAAAVIGAVGLSLLAFRDAWFGAGPAAIHDASAIRPRIHVCGRDYKATQTVVSRADWGDEAPFVLVEPAPFAGCSIEVDDPAGFCPAHPLACGTYTVVLVRTGNDAYVPYELVGGP